MIKRFSNKLLLAFSGVLLLAYGIIYACGADFYADWYYQSNSSFTPEAFVDESYAPLFLSGDIFYGIGFDNQHNSRFNDEITNDWETYLKGKMKAETVKYFLIDKSKKAVDELADYYRTKKENPSSAKWKAVIDLKNPKVAAFLKFLNLAKKVETASVIDRSWEYEAAEAVGFSDKVTIASIENEYATAKDVFMKNRYWFQLMKAYFYNGNQQKAFDFFEKTASLVQKNTLYYRALGYCAGMHYKNKEYALSNYMYSIIFDQCPQMRVVAAYSFHPQEEKDWNESLAFAKTNQEKAALWAIHGYYGDESNAIAKIVELDPGSKHLDYLLTRLINHQENEVNDATYLYGKVQKGQDAKVAMAQALELVKKIAALKSTSKPYLWSIALGYLHTLNGNYKEADAVFESVASQLPKTELAKSQLRLLQFVNNLYKIKVINHVTEKTILKDLRWLYNEVPEHKIENFRFYSATNASKSYLSKLYKAQGMDVMAELFLADVNFYDDAHNLKAMKAFLSKENETEIEKIAVGVYGVKLAEIYGFEAVKATYANKISEAIQLMGQSDSIQFSVFLGNPFNGNIKDCHDCEHAAYQKRKFTQMEFLSIVKEMQDKLGKNEDVYNNSLLLGNAFYNISHFGNARVFYESNIAGYGSSPYDFRTPIKKMIVNSELPRMYYKKAFEAAATREQKAKCVYLLAKCDRNDFYNKMFYFNESGYYDTYRSDVNFLAWNGFRILQKEYKNTAYYKEVILECGFFDSYVKGL